MTEQRRVDSAAAAKFASIARCMSEGERHILRDGTPCTPRTLLKRSISLDPEHSAAYFDLSLLVNPGEVTTLEDGSQHTEVSLLCNSIALNPHSTDFNNLACCLEGLGVTEIALHDGRLWNESELLLEAIRLDPSNALPYNNLGDHLHSLHCRHEATTHSTQPKPISINGTEYTEEMLFKKAISLDPTYSNAYANLAHILHESGVSHTTLNNTTIDVQTLLLKSIEFDSGNSHAFHRLAIYLEGSEIRLGDGSVIDEEGAWRRAIALDEDSYLPYVRLAALCVVPLAERLALLATAVELTAVPTQRAEALHSLACILPDTEEVTITSESKAKLSRSDLFRRARELDSRLHPHYNSSATLRTETSWGKGIFDYIVRAVLWGW